MPLSKSNQTYIISKKRKKKEKKVNADVRFEKLFFVVPFLGRSFFPSFGSESIENSAACSASGSLKLMILKA